MSTALAPCASCARHVKVDADRCPFCAAPFAGTPSPGLDPSWRLSRSAMAAFTASLSLVGAATHTAHADPQDHTVAVPAYGIAPPPARIEVTVGAPNAAPAGSVSAPTLVRAVRSRVGAVRACFQQAFEYRPSGAMSLTVRLTSAPRGGAVDATAVGPGVPEATRACVVGAFRAMVLPPHPGPLVVLVPVEAHVAP